MRSGKSTAPEPSRSSAQLVAQAFSHTVPSPAYCPPQPRNSRSSDKTRARGGHTASPSGSGQSVFTQSVSFWKNPRRLRCNPLASWAQRGCHRQTARPRESRRWCRKASPVQKRCRPPARNRWRANSSNLRWTECSAPPALQSVSLHKVPAPCHVPPVFRIVVRRLGAAHS